MIAYFFHQSIIDAVTGAAVTGNPPGDLDTVRINNRLRRSIDAALGGLTLLSPDPAKRYDAAQAVFKSREQNALPALEAAIAKENDSGIKRALEQARAELVLKLGDAPTNRGYRHFETPCCLGKTIGFDDLSEHHQRIEICHCLPKRNCIPVLMVKEACA